ncbi:MAG: ABC transporter ATP-binding protein [Acidimicrobiales bacterium]
MNQELLNTESSSRTGDGGKPRPATMLELVGVSRIYGDEPNQVVALDDVDFTVAKGELVALMGPSGSGKSTLLTIAGGLESPTSGRVDLDGHDLWGRDMAGLAEVRRRQIGFVFQDFNLLSGLTAAENVAAPLELDGVAARAARPKAMERLAGVGLADRADAFPDDLSGGERQRVAIARALIGDRRLILADEPTGALDSGTGAEVMRLLRAACTPATAVVVVTHDAAIAAFADRIVSIHDGRIEHGAPDGAPAR